PTAPPHGPALDAPQRQTPGGARPSRPAQNGHTSGPRRVVTSGAKSMGRRARSVAMITQRSTTGSLRSSGILAPGEVVGLFLGTGGAREEREKRLARRLALEQDRGDLRDHRRGHPGLAGERQPGVSGAHAL